jgi:AmmeMemoRadiSam system protein A
VQLPFIIKALGKVKIVPVIFGRVNNEQLQEFVEKIVQISETKNILVIVSTDLSHYNTYKKAVDVDSDTIGLIRNKDINSLRLMQEKGEGRACGISPLVVFLLYSQAKDAKINILKYANSGDTSGDKDRVVGYVSAVAYTPDKDYKSKSAGLSQEGKKSEKGEEMNEFNLSKEERVVLLNIARFTLENFLKDKKVPKFKVESQKLKEKRGVFVTLKKKGHLRGCIGVIVADTALYEAVSKLAIDSALNDPRFPALEHGELKEVEIEISVLTPFSEVKNLGEIEVGKHGLMIKKGFYSGLLLPQVPLEYNWDKETFLEHLCLKAGLPTSSYKDKDAILYKFSAIVFNESELAH